MGNYMQRHEILLRKLKGLLDILKREKQKRKHLVQWPIVSENKNSYIFSLFYVYINQLVICHQTVLLFSFYLFNYMYACFIFFLYFFSKKDS